jgi:hypothetical protein
MMTRSFDDEMWALLQDIVQYAIEDLPMMSERLHDALERAKQALAKGEVNGKRNV